MSESELVNLNQLRVWLQDLKKFGKGNHIEVVKGELNSDVPDGKLKVNIYTDINQYSIVGINNEKYEGHSYLGCMAQSRKPRAGETWNRGNDLPDGPLTFETWYSIVTAIIGYELVKVNSSRSNEVSDISEKEPSLGQSSTNEFTKDYYSWYGGSVDKDLVRYISDRKAKRKK